jgi:hypothetical protein
VKWILNLFEFIPNFERFETIEAELGSDGFTIGQMERLPFQHLLLDFIGEKRTFCHMFDHSKQFQYLLDMLTELSGQMI